MIHSLIGCGVSVLGNLVCILLDVFMVTRRVFLVGVSHLRLCHVQCGCEVKFKNVRQRATRNAAPSQSYTWSHLGSKQSQRAESSSGHGRIRAFYRGCQAAGPAVSNEERSSAPHDNEVSMGPLCAPIELWPT